MHTVKFCKEQKRSLIVLHHPPNLINQPKSLGNAKLISEKRADIVFESDEDLVRVRAEMKKVKIELLSGYPGNKPSPKEPIQTTLF